MILTKNDSAVEVSIEMNEWPLLIFNNIGKNPYSLYDMFYNNDGDDVIVKLALVPYTIIFRNTERRIFTIRRSS